MGKSKAQKQAEAEAAESETTPRSDLAGAPMEPASEPEPQGPEDALGPGKTRGDYRGRMGEAKDHYEGGEHQNPRTENIGDTEGRKGGVETSEEDD